MFPVLIIYLPVVFSFCTLLLFYYKSENIVLLLHYIDFNNTSYLDNDEIYIICFEWPKCFQLNMTIQHTRGGSIHLTPILFST